MDKLGLKRAYKNNSYYTRRKVSDMDIDFLSQFIGNSRRLNILAFHALKQDILTNGLLHPLHLVVGKFNKRVILIEGNHRLQALKDLGCTTVPVLIEVRDTVFTTGGYEPRHYDYINPSVQSKNPTSTDVFTKFVVVYKTARVF